MRQRRAVLDALSAAAADPQGFVERLPIPVIIGEIQRVPDLLLAIKAAVDQERCPGAFLITGSSRLDTLRGIRESLAGGSRSTYVAERRTPFWRSVRKRLVVADPPARRHFYRMLALAEVDFVLARGRRMIGLEVKASSTVRPSDARGIEARQLVPPRVSVRGRALPGRSALPLTGHAAAVPLAAFFAP